MKDELGSLLNQVPENYRSIFEQLYGIFDDDRDQKAFDCFIAPSAIPEQQQNIQGVGSALELIAKFVQQPERLSLLIQGPSGMGKSLLSQYIVCHLPCWGEQEILGQPYCQLPLWIYLPALPKGTVSKGNLLESFFKSQGIRDKAIGTIRAACQQGLLHLTLILDGWDEVNPCSKSLFSLNSWCDQDWPHIKVIITSRPEAITIHGNYANLFLPQEANVAENFSELSLLPFDLKQIEAYIKIYVDHCKSNPEAFAIEDDSFSDNTGTVRYWKNHEQYITHIQTLPGLQVLVTTPFLLNITAITLPSIIAQIEDGSFSLSDSVASDTVAIGQQVITRYGLYSDFVKHWFEIQAKRLWNNDDIQKNLLKYMAIPENNLAKGASYQQLIDCLYTYSENLARLALNLGEGKLDVVLEGEVALRPELFVTGHNQRGYFKQENTPEKVLAYIRSGCLLKQQGGSFRFLHKSLIEYFAARELFLGIGHTMETYMQGLHLEHVKYQFSINERLLMGEPEIIRLLADKAEADINFKELLYKVIRYSRWEPFVGTAAANAITVLNVAGEIFNDEDFQGICIPGANLSGACCDGTNFTGADLTNVIFRNAWLANANFSHACLENVDFGEMPVVQNDYPITATAVSRDGSYVAIGNSNGEVFLFEMATNKLERLFIKPKSDLSLGFRIAKYAETTKKSMEIKLSLGTTCNFNFGSNIAIQSLCFNYQGDYLAVYVEGVFFYRFDVRRKKLDKQVRLFENTPSIEEDGDFMAAPAVQGELLFTGGNEYLMWARSDRGLPGIFHNFNGDFYQMDFPKIKKFVYDSTRHYLLILAKVETELSQQEDDRQEDDSVQVEDESYQLSIWNIKDGIGNTNMIGQEMPWSSKPNLMAVSPGMECIALYHQIKIKEGENETTEHVIYVLNQSLAITNKMEIGTEIRGLSFDASGRFLTGTIDSKEYHAVRFWSAETGKMLKDLIYQAHWVEKLDEDMRAWFKFDRLVAFKYQDKDYLLYANESRVNFWTTDSLVFHKEQAVLSKPLTLVQEEAGLESHCFSDSILNVEFLDKNRSRQAFKLSVDINVSDIDEGKIELREIFRNNQMYNSDFGNLVLTHYHSLNETHLAVGFGKFMPKDEFSSYNYMKSWGFFANSFISFMGNFMDEEDRVDIKIISKKTKDTKIRVWNIQDNQQKLLYTLHSSNDALFLSLSPNSKFLAGCDINNKLKLWELTKGKRIWELQLKGIGVAGVAVNDQGLLAIFDQSSRIYFWEPKKTNQPILAIKHLWVKILNLKFTKDSAKLVCIVEEQESISNGIQMAIFKLTQAVSNLCVPLVSNLCELTTKNLLVFSIEFINEKFSIRLIGTDISLPLQAASANIDGTMGLSRFNQQLLQQRQAKGVPYIRKDETAAQSTGSDAPQWLVSSLAFKKATIEYSTVSRIKPRLPLNYNNWTVSLLRDQEASNTNHTFLLIEGLNSFGRCFFWRCDLANKYRGQTVESGFARVIIKREQNISIDRARDVVEKNMIKTNPEQNRGIHTVVGFCWSIRREQVLRLLKQIYHDETKLIPYHILGDQSFLSSGRHNCYTWAREKLLTLKAARIVQSLPDTFKDHLGVDPKTRLTLSPQAGSPVQPRACPVQ